KALRERGGKLVVVDPRRTRTADLADEHLFVKPGTDAYLLFGIVHTLLTENLTSINLEVNGLEELRRLAAEFPPERVTAICGVPSPNETARHAHVMQPPPRVLQMPHYAFLLLTVTVRDYTRFSPQILPLEPGRPSEAEIMARLVLIASGQGADADPATLDEMILGELLGNAVKTPGSPVEGKDAAELRAGLQGDSGVELMLDAMLKL